MLNISLAKTDHQAHRNFIKSFGVLAGRLHSSCERVTDLMLATEQATVIDEVKFPLADISM